MKTIEIDDDLHTLLKIKSSQERKKLKNLIAEILKKGLELKNESK